MRAQDNTVGSDDHAAAAAGAGLVERLVVLRVDILGGEPRFGRGHVEPLPGTRNV